MLAGSALLSGCLGTRYLQPNEKLLYNQTVKVPRGISAAPYAGLYARKSNQRLFGLPVNHLVWMYHTGEKHYDQPRLIARRDALEKRYATLMEKARSEKDIISIQYRKQKKLDAVNSKIDNGNLHAMGGKTGSLRFGRDHRDGSEIQRLSVFQGLLQGKCCGRSERREPESDHPVQGHSWTCLCV
ncbi:MAG: hypothetical protein U0V64_08985 [Cyclobacteriaceae bacterium]